MSAHEAGRSMHFDDAKPGLNIWIQGAAVGAKCATSRGLNLSNSERQHRGVATASKEKGAPP